MLEQIQNYDDEQIKIDILQWKLDNCLDWMYEYGKSPHRVAQSNRIGYELVMTMISAYYWEYPFLSRRLRNWIDDALQSQRDTEEFHMLGSAITENMPAAQIESLLDRLDE